MKHTVFVAGLILLMVVGVIYWNRSMLFRAGGWVAANDPKTLSYEVNGEIVKLENGTAETKSVNDPSVKISTRYFGNEASGDFNEDGRADVAIILTQNTGGTGTFYYVALALATETGYLGSNAVLIGDRIAPQSTTFSGGVITVNYADRGPEEPMTEKPTVGASLRVGFVDGRLIKL